MLTVRDLMTTDVFTIRSSATVAQAMQIMRDHNLRGLIVEKEYAQGAYAMVTERDIVYNVTAHGMDPHTVCIAEIMSKPCVTMDPDLSLKEAAHRFADQNIQRAPVVAGHSLLGIVSITDIIVKSDIREVDVPDGFSQRIQVALQHRRLSWDEEEQIKQDCDAVWDVMEDLQSEELEASWT
jgi:CBS domain-containing protein